MGNINDLKGISLEVPFVLTERQKKICEYLDILNNGQRFCNVPPSDLFKGALYSIYQDNRKLNPDWMAQASHSLRDIIYGFPKAKTKHEAIKKIANKYQEEEMAKEAAALLFDLYNVLTSIAHHFRGKNSLEDTRKRLERNGIVFSCDGHVVEDGCFEQIIEKLEEAWEMSLPSQLRVFNLVDSLFKKELGDISKEELESLMSFGYHVSQYFYSKADEKWLPWLWKNGFLESIKQKATEQTQYRMPELLYLARIAGNDPQTVAGFMLEVPISLENLNPEVVEQFLWICSELPAKELVLLVPKMAKENWISLINIYNHYGFKFEKMFESLSGAHDSKNIVILSSIMLTVREKKEKAEKENYWDDNPFYFKDLEGSGVFEFIEKIGDEQLEAVLAIVSKAMSEVVLFNEDKREPKESFTVGDRFAFYDVDFFELESEDKKYHSYQDDVRELAVVFRTLIMRTLNNVQKDENKARELFDAYVISLPDSQSMWRFRLFVLSIRPDVFAKEIKEALLRIAQVENPHDLTMGPEYERLLGKSLSLFSDEEKEEYKKIIFQYFSELDKEKLSKSLVFGICSIIKEWLAEEEIKKAEEYTGQPLNSAYQPTPSIGPMRGGSVHSASRVSAEELAGMEVSEIAENLRSKWAPNNLKEEREEKDGGITSYDSEGLGKAIQEDMTKRFQEYIKDAPLFFDREALDSHYTYNFLSGVYEIIQKKKVDLDINWEGIFVLFDAIAKSFEATPLKEKEGRRRSESFMWLAGWDAVHSSMADILKILVFRFESKTSIIDFDVYRKRVLDLITYLLSNSSPTAESEICKPREVSGKNDGEVKYDCSDPYTHAINSTRGKAFEALINFVNREGKQFSEDSSIKISLDAKNMYEDLLKRENTQAIMFLFGHYLASMFWRDKEWIGGLLSRIFDSSPKKYALSLAAWEGYLANNIYADLFQELESRYSNAIELDSANYTPREYFNDLDKALATHLALAFMHFPEFTLNSPLFKKFWGKDNAKRQAEFISFIGRYTISRDNAKSWMAENKVENVKKLEELWDWVLEQKFDAKVYESFGFWMDAEWGVFEVNWQAEHVRKTLEKTDGAVEWDHNIQESLPAFAEASPDETLEICKLYFLNYLAKKAENQGWIHIDDKMLGVFKTLYENPSTKEGTTELISALLPYGNGVFWKLKEIVK